MEMLPNIKRVPKRTLLCLYFSCVTFLLCAFYTFFSESDSALPENSIQNAYAESNIQSTFEGNFATKQILKDRSDIGPDEIVAPAISWTSSSMKVGKEQTAISHSISSLRNLPIVTSTKNIIVPQADTKYIYLANVSTQSFTSSKAASSVTTPAPTLSPDTCQTFSMKNAKLILLWTPFFDSWEYFTPQRLSECRRCRNCRITNDRTKIRESDAVIFHARDMSVSDLPPIRYPHQRWIFYCLESPPYSDFPGLVHMMNMFNWTMTYRSDSDVVTQYGTVVKLRPSQKLDLQSLRKSFENKSKSVVWMSSHCPTHGGRDDYVEELRKYIDVDIYGTCGSLECPPNDTRKCLHEFSLKYKFFLAFENTICKDYVTEKLYRTLEYNMIPVVFGGASYGKYAPPSSYIEAMSFKSPKHLAFFLSGVGNDFKMYSNYFKWRENFSVRTFSNKECELCSLLHQRDLKNTSYRDLRKWWVEESNCRTWTPKR